MANNSIDLNKTVFVFLGPPGSGKGTIAQQCKQRLDFSVISTGTLCRKHVAEKTELGKQLKKELDAGHLVSDELIMKMVYESLHRKVQKDKPIILDGYPRTRTQAERLWCMFADDYVTHILRVVVFELPEEEIIKRLINRRVCSNKECEAIYSLISMTPKKEGICDYCQMPLIQRDDDKETVIRERLRVYREHLGEIIEYYKSIKQPVEYLFLGSKNPEEAYQSFNQLLARSGGQKFQRCGLYK